MQQMCAEMYVHMHVLHMYVQVSTKYTEGVAARGAELILFTQSQQVLSVHPPCRAGAAAALDRWATIVALLEQTSSHLDTRPDLRL